MTMNRSLKKAAYKANYGGATPQQVAAALRRPQPQRQTESLRKAKQADG